LRKEFTPKIDFPLSKKSLILAEKFIMFDDERVPLAKTPFLKIIFVIKN